MHKTAELYLQQSQDRNIAVTVHTTASMTRLQESVQLSNERFISQNKNEQRNMTKFLHHYDPTK